MKRKLAANTLVFLEQLKNGVLQEEFLPPFYHLGFSIVEIRREFIKNLEAESKVIKEMAEKYQLEIYYSVPELLYDEGKLLYDNLLIYFKEAKAFHAKSVKLCIGNFNKVSQEDIDKVNQLCEEFELLLTIENDQTPDNGRIDKILKFLEVGKAFGSKIQATFDVGNWLWQHEDPITNAKLLKQYVTYIHLKDVKGGESPYTVLLDEGEIDWRGVLNELPQVPLALEYPCGTYDQELLVLEVEKIRKEYT